MQNGVLQPFSWSFVALAVLIAGTVAAKVKAKKTHSNDVDGFYPTVDLNTIPGLTIFFIAVGLILGLAFTGENPFVYFQF